MLKMFSVSLLLIILLFLIGASNILAILSHRVTFYFAFVLLAGVLTTAFVVLRKRTDKGTKNEEDDK